MKVFDISTGRNSEGNYSFVAEAIIDRSKNIPEFRLKYPKKEGELPIDPNSQIKTPYLVVK
jgi:hypothetical protein